MRTAVSDQIHTITDEAFILAQQFAAGSLTPLGRDRARELADNLSALAPPAESVAVAYSDAFLDIDWVLSEGRTPMSIRLALILRGTDDSAR